MSKQLETKGRCFCGAVEIKVVGEPAAMGYCHCTSCREWAAAPVNAFTLWPPGAVSVVGGAELLGRFQKTDRSIRRWCARCGGHVFTEHPLWGVVDVYAATIAGFPFKPGVHVNYAERVLHMDDGLPKQRDYPADMGGSGTLVAA
jgi:hypothetical protein